jgi:hypothetical protein
MPYVITTKYAQQCVCCGAGVVVPVAGGVPPFIHHKPERGTGDVCPRTGWTPQEAIATDDDRVTRRAVATLDEAREALCDAIHAVDPDATVFDIGGDGGSVGPLPDGTVIEVAPWTEIELATFTDLSMDQALTLPAGDIIDAYNAAQETRA